MHLSAVLGERVQSSSGCTAQPRPYHGPSSHDRDSGRRHVSPHRTAGSVVASAAAVAPASPSHDGLRSLPAELLTSIPDATPSPEDLEELHSLAMQVSRTGASRTVVLPPTARPGARPCSRPGPQPPARAPPDDVPPMPSPEAFLTEPPRADVDPGASPVHGPGQPLRFPHVIPSMDPPAASDAPARPPLPALGRRAGGAASSNGRPRPPGGSAAGAAGPRQPVMQLTMAIKRVQDWRQLPRLLEELAPASAGGLDPFNAAALLTHLAQRTAAAPPATPAEVQAVERMQSEALAVVEHNMHEYRGRQVSNMTWALARLGLPSGAAFIREHLLAAAYPLMPWYEPQHLSNTAWALAAAGVSPDDEWLEEYMTAAFVALQRRSLAPQHLANVLWALQRMGVMPEQDWMLAFYDCVAAALPASNDQDCSNTLSSLALMGMASQLPQPTAHLAAQLAARLRALLAAEAAAATAPAAASRRGSGDVSDQSIANSVWALTVMGCAAPEVEELWGAVAEALRARLADPRRPAPGVQPAALSIVLWAAASGARPLPAALTAALYGRVRRQVLEAMEPRSMATMVWSLATAAPGQARPPADWVSEALLASARSLTQLGPQALSNLLYGFYQMGARPPPGWMATAINHFHRDLGAEASPQSVANVLWCLAKLGYRLNAEGLDIMLGLVTSRLEAWLQHSTPAQQPAQRGLDSITPAASAPAALAPSAPPPFSSQEVSNLLYALASMGYAPQPGSRPAELLMAAARARLVDANAQELSNVMWSLAAIQIRPSDAWLCEYYAAAAARLASFKPADLAQSLYGAAKLQLPLRAPTTPSPAAAAAAAAPAAAPKASRRERRGAAGAAIEAPPPPAVETAGAAWLSAALAVAPRLVAAGSAQDLCDLSWALVQLRVAVAADGPLAGAFTGRLVSLASATEPAQLALGVWALGKWRVRPSRGQLQQLEVATFRQVPAMRPHELAAMLSGLAGMAHTPPSEWLEEVLQQIAGRSREFGPQDWTVVVNSLARLQDAGVAPQAEQLAARLLPRMHRMPLPSLVLLAYSCGCMGPSHTTRALVGRCLALLGGGGGANAAAGGSSDVVGEAPEAAATAEGAAARASASRAGKKGMRAGGAKGVGGGEAAAVVVAAPAAAELRTVAVGSLSPSELSALLWASVRVGFKALPTEFRAQFLSRTGPLLAELPASLVASYLWAAGRLRMWLPSQWRSALVARAEAVLPQMRGKEVVMCASGLLWLR
ncbi:hypothetical protein GPECTOR_8g41 [Gonium pectorale]|uniref:Tbc2 translation factor, chloroplastic n=1 Tax=Gonium pectorale TaxID=33097 RepID=A0A150GT66_GONPE|nr:hypothetical protein GPECTOR_8g41 [Gonium pectorale]|eukprot:KXZ53045.1 hypothetical protein GPECTOR_8g41 [Gonium pectorale]